MRDDVQPPREIFSLLEISPAVLGEELIGLDTVKKGTPLYGQPDWWGDDEQAQGDGQQNTSSNRGEKNTTFCCLIKMWISFVCIFWTFF